MSVEDRLVELCYPCAIWTLGGRKPERVTLASINRRCAFCGAEGDTDMFRVSSIRRARELHEKAPTPVRTQGPPSAGGPR